LAIRQAHSSQKRISVRPRCVFAADDNLQRANFLAILYCAVDRYPKGAVKGRRLLKAVLRAMMNLPAVFARHDLHSSSLTGDESYVVGQVGKLYANGDALGQPNPSEDRVHIG
jgi:hypothetical protein